jgi:hypothetical protein
MLDHQDVIYNISIIPGILNVTLQHPRTSILSSILLPDAMRILEILSQVKDPMKLRHLSGFLSQDI